MPDRLRTLDATIAELSPGGDGVAICEVDGERRAVFVGGVAAGERVRVEADFARRPARGRLLKVLDASSERVSPACVHVARCGGCDWMHLSVDAQARAHESIVRAAMRAALPSAFAGVEIVRHGAPRALAYRTRARVHVVARRGRVVAGMFEKRTHEPVPVDACVVLEPPVDIARRMLASLLDGATGRGEAHIALGAPGPRRSAVVDVRWSGDLPAAVFGRFERAVAAGEIRGARIFSGDVKVPATIGDPTPWIVGADGLPVRLSPGGFSQATEEGNALLARRANELADAVDPARRATVELYAGAGNLTVLLARERPVTAVELSREACDAARANLAARSLTARVIEADASRYAIGSSARLVVLDPPRTGAKDVAIALAQRPSPAIVYVSCDVATLARDLRVLADAGYRLAQLETFEMFPQTSHVETIAALEPPRPRR